MARPPYFDSLKKGVAAGMSQGLEIHSEIECCISLYLFRSYCTREKGGGKIFIGHADEMRLDKKKREREFL